MIFQPCAERALVTEFANQRRVTRFVNFRGSCRYSTLASADVATTQERKTSQQMPDWTFWFSVV